MKIGLISDTHGYLDPLVDKYFKECDEVWHVGDFGPNVSDVLHQKYTVRGVYGNIDNTECRSSNPEYQFLEREGISVLMIHIGGYPDKYSKRAKALIEQYKPNLFISGHSHICKIMKDEKNELLHFNPGAAGNHGFHKVKTIMIFDLENGKVKNVKVIELGPRA